jgi:outer membrane protein assembly factor BamB
MSCDGASDPFVVALDKRTGDVAWKVARRTGAQKKFSFHTPLVIEAGGRRQVVTCGSDVVQGLDPEDGSEIWSLRYDGYSVVPRPVFAHGLVFISTGYDNPVLMAIDPTGMGDVTATHLRWQSDDRAPNTPSPLVVGDELYTVSDGGIASCHDARSGEIHWQERVTGPVSASPLYADGHLYIQDERGKTAVLEAGTRFQKVAENDLREKSLASFATGPGCFFIRTERHLYRVGG